MNNRQQTRLNTRSAFCRGTNTKDWQIYYGATAEASPYLRRIIMRSVVKKIGVSALAVLSLAAATLATSSSAEARYWHRGWRGGWVGPAVVGGLALGALAASRPYYGYYDGGCYFRRSVVGYNAWGAPIVRPVRVCS
jgi:hypothetical protein